jgi:hypothetical protein
MLGYSSRDDAIKKDLNSIFEIRNMRVATFDFLMPNLLHSLAYRAGARLTSYRAVRHRSQELKPTLPRS